MELVLLPKKDFSIRVKIELPAYPVNFISSKGVVKTILADKMGMSRGKEGRVEF